MLAIYVMVGAREMGLPVLERQSTRRECPTSCVVVLAVLDLVLVAKTWWVMVAVSSFESYISEDRRVEGRPRAKAGMARASSTAANVKDQGFAAVDRDDLRHPPAGAPFMNDAGTEHLMVMSGVHAVLRPLCAWRSPSSTV